MPENSLLIGLSLALLLAVGLLVFGVGRVVYGIAHYYLRERKPVRQIRHAKHGLLAGEGGIWSGIAHPNDREVPFTLEGTEFAPDDLAMKEVDALIQRFAEVEKESLGFLRDQEAELRDVELEVYGLSVTNKPDCFTLEFIAKQDDTVVWRVEFEQGKPISSGFDD